MKRFFFMVVALLLIGMSLCSCMDNTANKVQDKASEAVSDLKRDMTESSTDNDRLIKSNTEAPTMPSQVSTDDPSAATEFDASAPSESNMMETVWDEMVENGEVDDGDGNVGDLENNDHDGNTDDNAADDAAD